MTSERGRAGSASHAPDAADLLVCDTLNPTAGSDWFIVCEHASDHIPDEYGGLGLAPEDRHSHIAWDPGAAGVARRLGQKLDATVVLHRFSRLLFDCNRPVGHPDAVRDLSEGRPVPGNRGLSDHERQTRAERFYYPFRSAVASLLDARAARGQRSLLVTIHSFNPVYLGVARMVELGIIHGDTQALAGRLFTQMRTRLPNVAWNEPYSAADDVTHTLDIHALPRQLDAVMIEIRNDLIADEVGQQDWAGRLADGLRASVG